MPVCGSGNVGISYGIYTERKGFGLKFKHTWADTRVFRGIFTIIAPKWGSGSSLNQNFFHHHNSS